VLPGEVASDSEDAVRSSRDRARDLGEAVLLPTGSGPAENELAVARNLVRGEHATFFEDDDGRGKWGLKPRAVLSRFYGKRASGAAIGNRARMARGRRPRERNEHDEHGGCEEGNRSS